MMQEFDPYTHVYDTFQMRLPSYRSMLQWHMEVMDGRKRVIDAGAGTGNLTNALLSAEHDVLAFDPNQESLDVLTTKCEDQEGLTTFHTDNIDSYADEGSYDGAVSSIVVPFPTDLADYFGTIVRALRSGAPFSISAWAPAETLEKQISRMIYGSCIELLETGYTKEKWDLATAIVKMGTKNERTVFEKNITLPVLKKLLTEAGFEDIQDVKNDPERLQYWLTCKKK